MDHSCCRSLSGFVVCNGHMILLEQTLRQCAVLNHTQIVSTYQWSPRDLYSEASHHIANRLNFFNCGSHSTELCTICACFYCTLPFTQNENWSSINQYQNACDGATGDEIVSMIGVNKCGYFNFVNERKRKFCVDFFCCIGVLCVEDLCKIEGHGICTPHVNWISGIENDAAIFVFL